MRGGVTPGQDVAVRRLHNLPAAPTPLLGRELELRAAREMLRQEQVRLLTLIGPGGSGKTRLALAVAEERLGAFEDGVWLVDLTPLREPALVLPAIARALGLRDAGGQPILEMLCERLRDQQLLLVLDNCEQVLDAAPQLAELLGACREVKILAASREPLRLRWEHELPVPPLALPDLERLPHLGTLGGVSSVELFVQRAQAIDPSFALTAENVLAVAGLCVRLDGLPLALELAAARTGHLPVRAILLRLEHGLSILTSDARDRPSRHRTLGEAIGWSYDLLDGDEQALFRRLSVFAGGCTFGAAEAVCAPPAAGEGGPASEAAILDLLGSLVDKSLLRLERAGPAEPRYRMLEMIREFAHQQLERAGEADEAARRHAGYYLALAEQAAPRMYAAEQQTWLGRLGQEVPNIRVALDWGRSNPTAIELWTRLATELGWFWWLHDDLSEGRGWLERVIAAIPADSSDPVRVRIRTSALNMAGMYARGQADYGRAGALLEEGLGAARRAGDRREVAWSLVTRMAIAMDQVDREYGAELSAEVLAICQEEGEDWIAGLALYFLGFMARGSGDYGQATGYHEESLALRRRIGDTWGIAWSLHDLGLVALGRGDFGRAEALLSEGLVLLRQLNHQRGVAWSLNDLGAVALATRETDRARELLVESLILRQRQGDRRGVAESLEYLAAAARLGGEAGRGARILGAAAALREAIGTPLWPVERARQERERAAALGALGEAGFEAAWVAGREMTIEAAVTYAVVESTPPALGPVAGVVRSALTPREWEVAALIARGYSNRKIAEALVISPHTAERHVERILAKLGCSSRAEVAAWMVRHETADLES